MALDACGEQNSVFVVLEAVAEMFNYENFIHILCKCQCATIEDQYNKFGAVHQDISWSIISCGTWSRSGFPAGQASQ